MFHIGLDFHKRHSQFVVLDEKGEVVRGSRVRSDAVSLAGFLRPYVGRSVVAMESSGSWYWVYDVLEELGVEVKMAHPYKVRLIAQSVVKTDKVDAKALADLERPHFLPQSYIPRRSVRDAREILRHRLFVVRARTQLKNHVHALLPKAGVHRPSPSTDLFGKLGREWLEGVAPRPPYRQELDSCLELLDKLSKEIKKSDGLVYREAKKHPEVKLLTTAPGVGVFTALLIFMEIGDIKRFAKPEALCCYAGLVPRVHQSSTTSYTGRITKRGNRHLRWIVIEAAQHAARRDPVYAQMYHRLAERRGKARAKVAIARKLLCAIWHMLTHNEAFSPSGSKPGKPVKFHGAKSPTY